ncbi:hypothetical protein BYT27DRAFT_7217386 [Phlegmacium glaucopus]|nr:hypothetical protein BYT27DRAFT_7217386 [Phlegmacium glaucopus]
MTSSSFSNSEIAPRNVWVRNSFYLRTVITFSVEVNGSGYLKSGACTEPFEVFDVGDTLYPIPYATVNVIVRPVFLKSGPLQTEAGAGTTKPRPLHQDQDKRQVVTAILYGSEGAGQPPAPYIEAVFMFSICAYSSSDVTLDGNLSGPRLVLVTTKSVQKWELN